MSSQLLEQAFGGNKKNSINEIDLYKDVLHVNKDCTKAQLRKAYYKQALKYHPDKNSTDEAKMKFQAISWVYNLLKDPTKRSDYDNDGVIPFDDGEVDSDDDDDGDGTNKKPNSWKDYFDLIFGKLSTTDIDNFAMKYKMSDEEEKDVIMNYIKFKGNFIKMLEYVMLSEERDVPRWYEDYIQPAIDSQKITNEYTKKMNSTLTKIKKKLEKEQQQEEEEEEMEEVEVEVDDDDEEEEEEDHQEKERDDDETETEESSGGDEEEEVSNKKKKKKKPVAATKAAKKSKTTKKSAGAAVAKKAPPPKKGKPTKAKKKKETSSSSQADLIAAIRNKSGRGNPLAAIGARYGVSMDSDDDDDDPLNDAEFEKIQAKLNKNKKRRKK